MKSLASARTTQTITPAGQLLLTIEHDAVRGVSPAMLRWWFENLGKEMTFNGQTYPRYLLWHPRDHIHWELAQRSPDGGSGKGAHFRIVEAFAANPAYYVDSTECVEKLDEEGISLVRRIAGVEIFRLEHRFGEVPAGASYKSRMVVGVASGAFRWPFNHIARQRIFSDAMGTAWLTHKSRRSACWRTLFPVCTPHGNTRDLFKGPCPHAPQPFERPRRDFVMTCSCSVKGGRPTYPAEVMVLILVLKRRKNVSDEWCRHLKKRGEMPCSISHSVQSAWLLWRPG